MRGRFDHAQQGAGDLAGAVAVDLRAIRAIGAVLAGTGKPFVGTNATGAMALAGLSGILTEDVTLPGGPRIDAENSLIALARQGVRSSVVRLPPTVHSHGRYGFVSGLIEISRATGTSGHLGDGSNRWPSADTRDIARLYRLALESAPAGVRLHAVAEEGIPLKAREPCVPAPEAGPDQAGSANTGAGRIVTRTGDPRARRAASAFEIWASTGSWSESWIRARHSDPRKHTERTRPIGVSWSWS